MAKAVASAKGEIKPTQGLASHYKLEESRKSTKRSEFRLQKKPWEKLWGWGFPEELHCTCQQYLCPMVEDEALDSYSDTEQLELL